MTNRGRHKIKKNPYSNLISKELYELMLKRQELAGNKPDFSIFINNPTACEYAKGFTWDKTEEGWEWWHKKINILIKNIENEKRNKRLH